MSPPLQVYKVTVDEATVIFFRYDQAGIVAADAEVMFIDPSSGDLFIVTKWDDGDYDLTRLFTIPSTSLFSSSEVLLLSPLVAFNNRLQGARWTRGDTT